MRQVVLMPLSFSVLILLGFQLLSPSSRAFNLEASVDIKPDTLNLNMQGRWITVYIGLPEGYNVSDIDASTILLVGLFRPEWSNIEGELLMVKFDASEVINNYLWDQLYHMGEKRGPIELMVEGRLINGTYFASSDTITIMSPLRG